MFPTSLLNVDEHRSRRELWPLFVAFFMRGKESESRPRIEDRLSVETSFQRQGKSSSWCFTVALQRLLEPGAGLLLSEPRRPVSPGVPTRISNSCTELSDPNRWPLTRHGEPTLQKLSVFPTCRFYICRYTYLLKCICDPKSILEALSQSFVDKHRAAKTLSCLKCLFLAEVEQGNTLLSPCHSYTVNKGPFQSLFGATFCVFFFCIFCAFSWGKSGNKRDLEASPNGLVISGKLDLEFKTRRKNRTNKWERRSQRRIDHGNVRRIWAQEDISHEGHQLCGS